MNKIAIISVLLLASTQMASAEAITAGELESICLNDSIGNNLTTCVTYIAATTEMMLDICSLQRKGKGGFNGFFAIDTKGGDGFIVIDAFLDDMADTDFRAKWGTQPAQYAIFFSAVKHSPCL